MADLQAFRQQYPEYDDMSDQALADALYRKFYSDMPRDQFDTKIGLGATPGDAEPSGPQYNFLSGTDQEEARAEIEQLPEDIQEAAWSAWGMSRVKNQRRDAEPGSLSSDDRSQRIVNSIPVIGGLADEASALVAPLFGNDPNAVRAVARANRDIANQGDAEPLIETPLGDIYGSGIEKAAGAIGGSLGLPGFGGGLLGGAATGAVYGGGDAFARGEGGFSERAEDAALGAGTGAVAGGVLGGIFGRGGNAAARDQLAQDATTVGVRVPNVAGRGAFGQGAGGVLSGMPWIGSPLVRAAQRARDDAGEATHRVIDRYVGAGHSNPTQAGEAASAGIRAWMRGGESGSAQLLNRVYAPVDRIMRQASLSGGGRSNMPRTRAAVTRLLAQHRAKYGPESQLPAEIRRLTQGVDNPNGLEFRNLQALRTDVIAAIDDSTIPGAGTNRPLLEQIRSAMTDDMRGLLRQTSPRAEQVWERANNVAQLVSQRRQMLTDVVGLGGNASGEAVIGKLLQMASEKTTANFRTLSAARRAMGENAWGQVSGSVIRHMGLPKRADQAVGQNQFSLSAFSDAYNKLSPRGRETLFGSGGRGGARDTYMADLDRIARIGDALRASEGYNNTSRSGYVMGALALSQAAMAAPVATAKLVIGGRVLSEILARPTQTRVLSHWLDEAAGPGSRAASTLLSRSIVDMLGEDGKDVDQKALAEQLSAMSMRLANPPQQAAEPTRIDGAARRGSGTGQTRSLADIMSEAKP